MRNEVNQLKIYRNQSNVIFESLAMADEYKVAEILERLKLGEAIESIGIRLESARLQQGESSQLRSMPSQQNFDPFLAVFGQAAQTPSINVSGSNPANLSTAREDERPNLHYSLGDGMKFEWESPHYDSSGRSTATSRAGSSVGLTPDNLISPQAAANVEPIIGNWTSHPQTAMDGVSQRDRGRRFLTFLSLYCYDCMLIPRTEEFLFGPDSMTVPDVPQSFNTANWTTITDDADLMDHLLALYFCWEYVAFPTFQLYAMEFC